MDTKDKLIEKLEDYVDYLITYPHSSFKKDKFESEIAALKMEIKEENDNYIYKNGYKYCKYCKSKLSKDEPKELNLTLNEKDLLEKMNNMCIESLPPKHFENWEGIKEQLLLNRIYPNTKTFPIEPEIPMGEMKSASYMQVRDLTDEEWLQLSKEEVIRLYKNCYKMLSQFTTQRILIAKSGHKYLSIPDDIDIETWDRMTVTERMRYKGLIGEVIAERQEITDEEIENEADLQYGDTTIIPETAFIAGAKWMRDKMR